MTVAPTVARRLLEIEQEEIALLRMYPSQRYVPCGAIGEWIDAVGRHDQRSGKVITYLLSGANGVGKTRGLSEMAAALLRGPQGPWLDRPLFRDFPRPCRVRLVSSQAALEEGALRELKDLLGPNLASGYPKKAGNEWDAVWVLRDGSRMDAYSWQQGLTTHAGASVDAVLLDEPGPRAVYDEVTARLRGGGPVIWGMTPVDGKSGSGAEVGWVFAEIQRAEEGGAGAWVVLYADAEDSCIEHGIRGRVPHQVIQDRMDRWSHDPATLKARFYGRHALELGRVLKEWDPTKHVIDKLSIRAGWPRYAAMDTHPSKPQVYNYGVLTPFHELIVVKEIVSTGLISDVANEIKGICTPWGWPGEQIIDPLAATPNPITGKSILSTYRDNGISFRTAGPEKSDKDAGINLVRERLTGVDGRPLLFVHKDCKLTISQASRWMIDPRTLKPAKEHDDCWENIYRIALNLPPYPVPQAELYKRAVYPIQKSSLVV